MLPLPFHPVQAQETPLPPLLRKEVCQTLGPLGTTPSPLQLPSRWPQAPSPSPRAAQKSAPQTSHPSPGFLNWGSLVTTQTPIQMTQSPPAPVRWSRPPPCPPCTPVPAWSQRESSFTWCLKCFMHFPSPQASRWGPFLSSFTEEKTEAEKDDIPRVTGLLLADPRSKSQKPGSGGGSRVPSLLFPDCQWG